VQHLAPPTSAPTIVARTRFPASSVAAAASPTTPTGKTTGAIAGTPLAVDTATPPPLLAAAVDTHPHTGTLHLLEPRSLLELRGFHRTCTAGSAPAPEPQPRSTPPSTRPRPPCRHTLHRLNHHIRTPWHLRTTWPSSAPPCHNISRPPSRTSPHLGTTTPCSRALQAMAPPSSSTEASGSWTRVRHLTSPATKVT
jgi:hypothetical protein